MVSQGLAVFLLSGRVVHSKAGSTVILFSPRVLLAEFDEETRSCWTELGNTDGVLFELSEEHRKESQDGPEE